MSTITLKEVENMFSLTDLYEAYSKSSACEQECLELEKRFDYFSVPENIYDDVFKMVGAYQEMFFCAGFRQAVSFLLSAK